ncbi:hypothetical protein [Nocardia sp. NPDC051832]|uniref:hypothetical protein n=1 Tax=Nocardia sp. NPDC051832 TaxID=3155673 RepID=UPI0034491234
MKLLTGDISAGKPTWSSRWFWLRYHLYGKRRDMPAIPKGAVLGPVLRREYRAWIVRPQTGWRRWRWVTPPLHATWSIPARDEDAACDWMLDRMGM